MSSTLLRPLPHSIRWLPSPSTILLLLILALALSLRLYGVNWDSGYGFHPDERSLYMRAGCMYRVLITAPGYEDCIREYPQTQPGLPNLGTFLDANRSPLNPHWFPLGSILIYILVFFRSVIEVFTDVTALDLRYVGRPLSALADVGSVFLVYVLGRRLYGAKTGLLAAALTALAVVHIQNSHFYRPETFSVFFILASFWAMLRMVEHRRLRDSVLLGVMVGLAMAPKVSVLPLLLPLALAYAYRVLEEAGGRWSAVSPGMLQRMLAHAAAAVAAAAAVFFLLTPYALLDFTAFIGDLAAQTRMARHAGLWPFTVQYIDTPPYIYQIQQTTVWGLGIPLGVLAWAAIPFTAVMAWRNPETRRGDLLLLAWVVPQFVFLQSFEVHFLRYVFPLMPVMILLPARMLVLSVGYLRTVRSRKVQEARSNTGPPPTQCLALPISPFPRGIGQHRWIKSPLAPLCKGGSGGFRLLHCLPPPRKKDRFPLVGDLWVMISSQRWELEGGVRDHLPKLGVALVVLVVGATAFYALAFTNIYSSEHPAVAASRWIQQNVPPGTAIVSDTHWDESIPELYRHDVWQFPVYEPDSREKMEGLAHHLAEAEYLVFYSFRPYLSAARAPEHYPLSSGYYRQLFSGDLGYRLERTFTSHPELLGVTFEHSPYARAGLPEPVPLAGRETSPLVLNLGYADDNVVGYDHPQVLLFRNVERSSEPDLFARLMSGGNTARPPKPPGLLLSEEDKARQRGGGTWSELFDRDSWTNRVPVLAWLLVVELFYIAALPLAIFLFRPLPDRGIVLARVLGLLAAGYVAWLVVSLGWLDFSTGAIILGLLVVGSLSALVLAFRWREIRGFVTRHWKLLLLGEGLFLLAFLAFVGVRALNPDLWHPARGGEKPMELAYLNAVVRSTTFPPYDPWYAGGYLNYYYWGYFIVALPVRLAGIIPTTAFNLAVPLFFALTFTGAYSLVYNLAAGVRRSRDGGVPSPDDESKGRPARRVPGGPVAAGLMAGFFASVMGNLDGAVQLAQGVWGKLLNPGQPLAQFDFWRSSRMIPPLENINPPPLAFWVPDKNAGAPEVSYHITEFPFFTFLFADLHAHMMAIPFALLVIGLGLNLVVGLRDGGRFWALGAAVALGLALGSLWVINSWDYPSYLVLVVALLGVAVFLKPWSAPKRAGLLAVLVAAVVFISVAAFWPFHQAYETFDAGVAASKWRTPLDRYVGIHGLFLFVAVAFLAYQARYYLARALQFAIPRVGYAGLAATSMARRELPGGRSAPHNLTPGVFLGVLSLAAGVLTAIYLAAAGYWTGAVLLVLLVLCGLAAWHTLTSKDADRAYAVVPLVLLALALAIGLGVDLVRLDGDIGRMNTLFKLYLEAWVLFSLAAGYMLWRLGSDGWLANRWTWLKRAWLGALVLLLASSTVYAFLGTQARVADRFPGGVVSLEGSDYMNNAVHREEGQLLELKWDLEGIQWLQNNVDGSPVVLEAHNDQYHWSARIASYTGLPTVIGWPWHQIQQRTPYADSVRERAADVRELYNTTDINRTRMLLAKYEVKYIVVGGLERAYYSAEGLEKFEEMVGLGLLKPVFENEKLKIYRIM